MAPVLNAWCLPRPPLALVGIGPRAEARTAAALGWMRASPSYPAKGSGGHYGTVLLWAEATVVARSWSAVRRAFPPGVRQTDALGDGQLPVRRAVQ